MNYDTNGLKKFSNGNLFSKTLKLFDFSIFAIPRTASFGRTCPYLKHLGAVSHQSSRAILIPLESRILAFITLTRYKKFNLCKN